MTAVHAFKKELTRLMHICGFFVCGKRKLETEEKGDLITSGRVGTLFVTYVGRIKILTPHYQLFTLT